MSLPIETVSEKEKRLELFTAIHNSISFVPFKNQGHFSMRTYWVLSILYCLIFSNVNSLHIQTLLRMNTYGFRTKQQGAAASRGAEFEGSNRVEMEDNDFMYNVQYKFF